MEIWKKVTESLTKFNQNYIKLINKGTKNSTSYFRSSLKSNPQIGQGVVSLIATLHWHHFYPHFYFGIGNHRSDISDDLDTPFIFYCESDIRKYFDEIWNCQFCPKSKNHHRQKIFLPVKTLNYLHENILTFTLCKMV